MSLRPEPWRDEHFLGWPLTNEMYLSQELPPEFRPENEDLRVPRQENDLGRLENYLIFRPFF